MGHRHTLQPHSQVKHASTVVPDALWSPSNFVRWRSSKQCAPPRLSSRNVLQPLSGLEHSYRRFFQASPCVTTTFKLHRVNVGKTAYWTCPNAFLIIFRYRSSKLCAPPQVSHFKLRRVKHLGHVNGFHATIFKLCLVKQHHGHTPYGCRQFFHIALQPHHGPQRTSPRGKDCDSDMPLQWSMVFPHIARPFWG